MVKSIIIDPGHGGTDPGANGFGVQEKAWNLRVSLYQLDRLKELGAKVGITRTTDKTLSNTERTNLIKNGGWDYCVSNHWNAFNGTARGVETIHSRHANPSFAKNLANAIVRASGLPLRRVFTRNHPTISGADYYFMHRLTGNVQTVIIEYGFIDNKRDHDWFKNDANFYKAAEVVIEQICRQIGITYKAKGNTAKPSIPKPTLPGTLHKVQAGSFVEEKGAEVRYALLDSKGFDPVIMFRDGEYKVQVGAYGERKYADAQLARVRKVVPDAFIQTESGEPAQNKPTPTPAPAPAPKPKPVTTISGAKLVKNENAFFLATENIKVRNAPSTGATHTGTLPKGASINYKRVFEGNGYRWLEYVGSTGNTLYLPYRPLTGYTKSWGTFHSSRPASALKKSVDTVAKEILFGRNYGGWGTGEARRKKLREAGYEPSEVQRRINQLA